MWFWFGFALVALIGEVLSGTFYLLLIAAGFVAGGVIAWADGPLIWQLVAVGVVSALGLLILRKTHVLKKSEVNAGRNRDVNLDIGEQVVVTSWTQGQTTQVRYRGAHWSARLAPGHAANPGKHRIVEVEGAMLIIVPESASR